MTKNAILASAPLRKYRVLYAITREEFYEVEAASADEAKELAFTEGECVNVGDTTGVTECEVEEISADGEV